MLTILMLLVAVTVAGIASTAMVGSFQNKRDKNRIALKGAESALRRIANGSANPALEAQIALDEIDGHIYNKELN